MQTHASILLLSHFVSGSILPGRRCPKHPTVMTHRQQLATSCQTPSMGCGLPSGLRCCVIGLPPAPEHDRRRWRDRLTWIPSSIRVHSRRASRNHWPAQPAVLTMTLLRLRNCPHLLAHLVRGRSGLTPRFAAGSRGRPAGPDSPKGFGSYREPAGIYGHLQGLTTIPAPKIPTEWV